MDSLINLLVEECLVLRNSKTLILVEAYSSSNQLPAVVSSANRRSLVEVRVYLVVVEPWGNPQTPAVDFSTASQLEDSFPAEDKTLEILYSLNHKQRLILTV